MLRNAKYDDANVQGFGKIRPYLAKHVVLDPPDAVGALPHARVYAASLEDYTLAEPLPRTNFYIARGRALVAHGRGDRDDVTIKKLRDLRDEAARMELNSVLPAFDQVLATA